MRKPDPPARERGARYSAPALEKGLDIIETLSEADAPLTLSTLAERMGRSRNEIFRMAAVLEARHYIRREGDGFVVTSKLFELGMRHPPVQTLLEAAVPVMSELARELGQSCHLAVASEGRNVVVGRAVSPGEHGLSVALGHSRNLLDSTGGRALLAHQPPARLQALLDSARARDGDGPDEATLEADLEAIRERGFAVAPSRSLAGVSDIAAPILDGFQAAVAVLTVTYMRRADAIDDLDGAAAAAVQAAGRIAARLEDPG